MSHRRVSGVNLIPPGAITQSGSAASYQTESPRDHRLREEEKELESERTELIPRQTPETFIVFIMLL